MAEKLSEVVQIFENIKSGNNFLLSGGAGSGKTFTLVEVLKKIFEEKPKAKVRCITFTNVAVDEINSRVSHDNLKVSTIHDFIWDCIKGYQKNLKASLIELINSDIIGHSFTEKLEDCFFQDLTIEYKEWTKLSEGIVSHDEVLLLGKLMFERFPLLGKILKDKYDFILLDEYQDTAPGVVSILLDYLPTTNKNCIIGFFGDSMQSIYDGTVGSISEYVRAGKVKEVVKQDNRRNPSKIIELANRIRTDTVKQEPANDPEAPNYKLIGDLKFFYSHVDDIDNVKRHSYFDAWDFSNPEKTKELYLTHNLIAAKARFSNLVDIYDKDKVIEYKRSVGKYIKENGIQISADLTFGDVIELVKVKPTRAQQEFFDSSSELLEEAKSYKFELFSKIYVDKDQLLGSKKGSSEEERNKGTKRDALINHLFHIEDCIVHYAQGNYNQFLKQTGLVINSITEKTNLKNAIETLKGFTDKTIEEVVNFAHKSGVYPKSERLLQFVDEKTYVYNRVKKIKYSEFRNLYNFVEGYTPFSTQHNIKGAEYDNVFVVLDNGRWNNYNFKNLFLNNGSESVLARTKKIFYVCCTRAKKNLALYYHDPEKEIIAKATELFGSENVIHI